MSNMRPSAKKKNLCEIVRRSICLFLTRPNERIMLLTKSLPQCHSLPFWVIFLSDDSSLKGPATQRATYDRAFALLVKCPHPFLGGSFN